ncbi:MAG: outer membrane protein transport protein [Bacteroides sp.]|nr:outer membrane protein transport protein [Bacteroides sp.]
MKKIITLATVGLLMAAAPADAQTVYDAAKIMNTDLNGTARFVGMGGAMGALGGDISTIGINPAGIGIYRSNDVMVSFGLSSYGTESNYMGNKMNSDKLRGDFNNAGFALSTKIGNATALRYVNFGFNYNRAKSFYKNMSMNGNLGKHSQTFQMAEQATGIIGWGGYPYNDANIGWLSILGYDSWLISDLTTNVTNTPYKDKDGNQIYNVNGKPLYTTPGSYIGMYDYGDATFRSEERGGIDQYDFNISFNINDRVYLGMTIGAYEVDYSKYTVYSERYTGDYSGEGYTLTSMNKIHGSGFDFKFGAIIRPFEYSPLRIGLAVHTPTFYSLDYKTSAYVLSDIYNEVSGKIEPYDIYTSDMINGDMVREFRLRTPWKYNVSLGYTIGNSWALGAEYEYQDYSSMKFKNPDDGYSDMFEYENSTRAMMKGVNTVRLGAEYKVIPEFAIRAGYNYTSAIFHGDAYKDLPENSIQTDTDFANTKAMSNYTLGIGYRGSMFYADLAYKFSSYKENFYPFVEMGREVENGVEYRYLSDLPSVTKVKNTRSQVLLTLGMRF